ncbi:MAG: hypothetical protein GY852_02040 [bacterium]|nr:hypothetical protein [bacterium]
MQAVSTIACEELAECEDSGFEYIPVYMASLGSISDYRGARPSEFRSVMLELIEELNANSDILVPGEIKFEIALNNSGVVIGIRMLEDTVEVEAVEEIVENFLMGKTIAGASIGTSTVSIMI